MRAWAARPGCGTDNAASEVTRPGWRPATYQARAAPQSCPARWNRCAPAGVGQREHVRRQLGVPFADRLAGRGPRGVAAQVGRQHPVAVRGERGRRPVPAAAVLRKAMQENGDTFPARPCQPRGCR